MILRLLAMALGQIAEQYFHNGYEGSVENSLNIENFMQQLDPAHGE